MRRGTCLTLNVSSKNNPVAIKNQTWEFLKGFHFPCWETYGNYAPLLKVKLVNWNHSNKKQLIFECVSGEYMIHTYNLPIVYSFSLFLSLPLFRFTSLYQQRKVCQTFVNAFFCSFACLDEDDQWLGGKWSWGNWCV